MLLSNCNIQELVTEQINAYLSDNELSFKELKAYVTSKSQIPEVQTQCIKILSESKHTDLIQVKKVLETQAYKKQLSEDEKQTKLDLANEERDHDQKKRLTRELKRIPDELTKLESECILLRHKLTRLISAAPHVQVTHQHENNIKKTKNSTKKSLDLEEHSLAIDRLNTSIRQHEIKIQILTQRSTTLQIQLQELEDGEQKRRERKRAQSSRNQARAAYQSTGEGILDTLSLKNQTQLTQSITGQHKALEIKCTELIEDAQAINFAFFLGLLPKHLSHLKLTVQEDEALRHVLKLMKQHLQYTQHITTTQETLNKKKQSISNQIIKLNELNSKLKHLQRDNPNLTDSNKHLSTLNTELKTALERNTNLQKRLAMPGLLLLTLTFLSTIPLILTVYGIIPFFIAPVFLFMLVSAPPVLLLITTIAIGITALVYRIKAHTNETSIQMNLQSIQTNNNQVKRNSSSLHLLRDETIPNLEVQIKKDEAARDNLIASLKESQQQAEQSLKQAKEINPVSYSGSTVLVNSSLDSSDDETDEEVDLEENAESVHV